MEWAAPSVAKPLQSEKKMGFFLIEMEHGKIEFEWNKCKLSQEQRSHWAIFFFLKWRITFVLFGQPLANSKIYLEKLRRRIHFSRDIEK